MFVEGDVGGFDDEFAALGHGVAGVDGQVDQDLFHLAQVYFHWVEVLAWDGYQFYILAEETAQHLIHIEHQVVEAYHFWLQELAAGEGQELSGEVGGAVGGVQDLLDVVVCWL